MPPRLGGPVSTPKCVEHDYDMVLERFEWYGQGKDRKALDIYGCSNPGCVIKYVETLGGYGIFNAEKFVLIKAEPN